VNACDDDRDRELPSTLSVCWEAKLLNVFELCDVNGIRGNEPVLIGPLLNKLLMKGKTGWVVVESAGVRSTRNETGLQDGSRTISRCSCI
jgi:hypothetical protein